MHYTHKKEIFTAGESVMLMQVNIMWHTSNFSHTKHSIYFNSIITTYFYVTTFIL